MHRVACVGDAKRNGIVMFNDNQKSEIRHLAEEILVSRKWDALPWSDAWAGVYPVCPSNEEIEREAQALEIKATRIISGGPIQQEYGDLAEHIRMISLESARSFNIYHKRGG